MVIFVLCIMFFKYFSSSQDLVKTPRKRYLEKKFSIQPWSDDDDENLSQEQELQPTSVEITPPKKPRVPRFQGKFKKFIPGSPSPTKTKTKFPPIQIKIDNDNPAQNKFPNSTKSSPRRTKKDTAHSTFSNISSNLENRLDSPEILQPCSTKNHPKLTEQISNFHDDYLDSSFVEYVSREIIPDDQEIWTKRSPNIKLEKFKDLICDTKIIIYRFKKVKFVTYIKNSFGHATLNHQTKIAHAINIYGAFTDFSISEVEAIHATSKAFAALKSDGTVELWGNKYYGGKYFGQPLLKNIKEILPNKFAFCALNTDRQVHCWGHPEFGGEIQPIILTPVEKIVATQRAFAALGRNNIVYTWGSHLYGGNKNGPELAFIEYLAGSFGAFAAKKKDGYYMYRNKMKGDIVLWGLGDSHSEADKNLKDAIKRNLNY